MIVLNYANFKLKNCSELSRTKTDEENFPKNAKQIRNFFAGSHELVINVKFYQLLEL